jgi:hypothetical protein
MPAGVGNLGGGDQARKASADHDHVCIVGHCALTQRPQ